MGCRPPRVLILNVVNAHFVAQGGAKVTREALNDMYSQSVRMVKRGEVLIPGDLPGIVSDKTDPGEGYEGQNLVQLFGDRCWGHAAKNQIMTFDEWMKRVERWEGGTGKPVVEFVWFPIVGLRAVY